MLLFLAAFARSPVNTTDLRVELSMVLGEQSKDSHVERFLIRLQDDTVIYAGPHPPCERGRCNYSEVDFLLTNELYDELILAIERGHLVRSFRERRSIEPMVGTYAEVALNLSHKGKRGTTALKGPRRVHHSGANLAELSARAKARLAAVQDLVAVFEAVGRPMLIQRSLP